MILYCLFDPLWLDTDIPLRGTGTTMLQQPLHKGNIESIGIIDFCGIPLAKAVGADSLEAQVIADNMQLLLHCPFCNGEYQLCAPDVVAQTVVFDILVYGHGNSEHSALAKYAIPYLLNCQNEKLPKETVISFKVDSRSLLEGEKLYPCYFPTNHNIKNLIRNTVVSLCGFRIKYALQ